MNNRKVISIIGFAWLFLWTSYVPQLISHYPFQEHKGVKSLIEEVIKAPDFIKKEAGLLNKTPAELESSIMRELRIGWLKSISLVILGLLTAILLLKKKKSGRILALALAGFLLLLKIIYFVKYWHYNVLSEYWEVNFCNFPVQTIQSIIAAIVMIATLILMPNFQRKPNEPVHSDA